MIRRYSVAIILAMALLVALAQGKDKPARRRRSAP
jgi:hypothetical protein